MFDMAATFTPERAFISGIRNLAINCTVPKVFFTGITVLTSYLSEVIIIIIVITSHK